MAGASSGSPEADWPLSAATAGRASRRRRRRDAWTLREDRAIRQSATGRDWAHTTPESDRLFWQHLATQLPGRQPAELRGRWETALNPRRVKGAWNDVEDNQLRAAVAMFGARDWNNVAVHVGGRNAKQCRERWCNSLAPGLAKGPWTDEEQRILVEAHAELGNAWAEIARRLPGRSSSSVKNTWYSLQNLEERLHQRHQQQQVPAPLPLTLGGLGPEPAPALANPAPWPQLLPLPQPVSLLDLSARLHQQLILHQQAQSLAMPVATASLGVVGLGAGLLPQSTTSLLAPAPSDLPSWASLPAASADLGLGLRPSVPVPMPPSVAAPTVLADNSDLLQLLALADGALEQDDRK